MKKEKDIGIIGHVDHGRTTLSAAIHHTITELKPESMSIQEHIEQEKSFIINANPILEIPILDYKTGPEKRRERRARKRKKK